MGVPPTEWGHQPSTIWCAFLPPWRLWTLPGQIHGYTQRVTHRRLPRVTPLQSEPGSEPDAEEWSANE